MKAASGFNADEMSSGFNRAEKLPSEASEGTCQGEVRSSQSQLQVFTTFMRTLGAEKGEKRETGRLEDVTCERRVGDVVIDAQFSWFGAKKMVKWGQLALARLASHPGADSIKRRVADWWIHADFL